MCQITFCIIVDKSRRSSNSSRKKIVVMRVHLWFSTQLLEHIFLISVVYLLFFMPEECGHSNSIKNQLHSATITELCATQQTA